MRTQVCGFLLVVSLVGVVIAPVRAQEDTGQTPPEYLEIALDYIQENSIYTDRVDDWEALRAEAFAMIEDATTTQETYPAIRYVFEAIGDIHGGIVDPEVTHQRIAGQSSVFGVSVLINSDNAYTVADILPDSPAALAGIQQGDILVAIDGQPISEAAGKNSTAIDNNQPIVITLLRGEETLDLSVTNPSTPYEVYRAPKSQRFGEKVGYTQWFELGGSDNEQYFPGDAKAAIKAVNDLPVCGWIVDLRQNSGGNMWPMLAGVGPILGEGIAGYFVTNHEASLMWGYQNGQALMNGQVLSQVFYPLDPMPDLPVAVLTSPLTASAGEAMLIAFIGRPSTQRFGEASAGLTTGVSGIPLLDGALLRVATSFMVDRIGTVYDGPVTPDEFVPIDWANYGTESDPVIQAALTWLDSNYDCR